MRDVLAAILPDWRYGISGDDAYAVGLTCCERIHHDGPDGERQQA
jgi:hypothetical protein